MKNLNKHSSKFYTLMFNKHIKKCSASSVIRKMQLKTIWDTSSYSLGLLKLKQNKTKPENKYWRCGEIRTPIHCWENYKIMQPLWKPLLLPQKINIALSCDPAIPLLNMSLRKIKTYVHQEFVHGYSQQHYLEYPRSENSSISMNGYSTHEWTSKMCFIHTMEYYLAIKNLRYVLWHGWTWTTSY